MNAPTLLAPYPAQPQRKPVMTAAELRAFDVAAVWARLTPEQQTTIGEALIAYEVALFVALEMPADHPDLKAVEAMSEEAGKVVEAAIEAATPELPWPKA